MDNFLEFRRKRFKTHISNGLSELEARRNAQYDTSKKFGKPQKNNNSYIINTEDNPYYKAKNGIK